MLFSATVIGQLVWAGEHHGEQEVVPGRGELPDQHHHKAGHRDRQQDVPVGAQHAGAVDAGGLEQLLGDAGVVVAEGQGGDRHAVDDVRQDQARQSAVEVDARA